MTFEEKVKKYLSDWNLYFHEHGSFQMHKIFQTKEAKNVFVELCGIGLVSVVGYPGDEETQALLINDLNGEFLLIELHDWFNQETAEEIIQAYKITKTIFERKIQMETKDRLKEFTSSLAKLLLDKNINNPSVNALRDGLTEESKQTLKAWRIQKI